MNLIRSAVFAVLVTLPVVWHPHTHGAMASHIPSYNPDYRSNFLRPPHGIAGQPQASLHSAAPRRLLATTTPTPVPAVVTPTLTNIPVVQLTATPAPAAVPTPAPTIQRTTTPPPPSTPVPTQIQRTTTPAPQPISTLVPTVVQHTPTTAPQLPSTPVTTNVLLTPTPVPQVVSTPAPTSIQLTPTPAPLIHSTSAPTPVQQTATSAPQLNTLVPTNVQLTTTPAGLAPTPAPTTIQRTVTPVPQIITPGTTNVQLTVTPVPLPATSVPTNVPHTVTPIPVPTSIQLTTTPVPQLLVTPATTNVQPTATQALIPTSIQHTVTPAPQLAVTPISTNVVTAAPVPVATTTPASQPLTPATTNIQHTATPVPVSTVIPHTATPVPQLPVTPASTNVQSTTTPAAVTTNVQRTSTPETIVTSVVTNVQHTVTPATVPTRIPHTTTPVAQSPVTVATTNVQQTTTAVPVATVAQPTTIPTTIQSTATLIPQFPSSRTNIPPTVTTILRVPTSTPAVPSSTHIAPLPPTSTPPPPLNVSAQLDCPCEMGLGWYVCKLQISPPISYTLLTVTSSDKNLLLPVPFAPEQSSSSTWDIAFLEGVQGAAPSVDVSVVVSLPTGDLSLTKRVWLTDATPCNATLPSAADNSSCPQSCTAGSTPDETGTCMCSGAAECRSGGCYTPINCTTNELTTVGGQLTCPSVQLDSVNGIATIVGQGNNTVSIKNLNLTGPGSLQVSKCNVVEVGGVVTDRLTVYCTEVGTFLLSNAWILRQPAFIYGASQLLIQPSTSVEVDNFMWVDMPTSSPGLAAILIKESAEMRLEQGLTTTNDTTITLEDSAMLMIAGGSSFFTGTCTGPRGVWKVAGGSLSTAGMANRTCPLVIGSDIQEGQTARSPKVNTLDAGTTSTWTPCGAWSANVTIQPSQVLVLQMDCSVADGGNLQLADTLSLQPGAVLQVNIQTVMAGYVAPWVKRLELAGGVTIQPSLGHGDITVTLLGYDELVQTGTIPDPVITFCYCQCFALFGPTYLVFTQTCGGVPPPPVATVTPYPVPVQSSSGGSKNNIAWIAAPIVCGIVLLVVVVALVVLYANRHTRHKLASGEEADYADCRAGTTAPPPSPDSLFHV